ncbi:hypothetical protein GCM10012275_53370 [Longimycelium tulufanense]|uniref:Uncharacterized protein n=1 Tax=Longimycelium tulufanense TaxID=907463 RepID=A0A8J3FX16_9PSEU|nr:hypothetical protein [Longimycelium tulufanense]GGM75990.1 hypothetical protein GCM10012275_53370 [Longimycelium tulufanense]
MADSAIEPNACRWCHAPQREHYQRWKRPVGWHRFAHPTDAQRLTRMRARRTKKEEAKRG